MRNVFGGNWQYIKTTYTRKHNCNLWWTKNHSPSNGHIENKNWNINWNWKCVKRKLNSGMLNWQKQTNVVNNKQQHRTIVIKNEFVEKLWSIGCIVNCKCLLNLFEAFVYYYFVCILHSKAFHITDKNETNIKWDP